MGIGSCIHLDTTLLRNQCKYVNGCILLFFSPFTPHWSTPPCSCAAGQCSLSLSLSPSQSGSLVLAIKKLPIWLEEDIIAIMTAAALHITQYADCSSEQEEKGGGKHCLLCADATQYYHSVTTAHPHTQIHTDRVSTQFFLFSAHSDSVIFQLSAEQTRVSIGIKIHTPLPLKKKKKEIVTVKPWVNTHLHTQCHHQ